MNPHGKNLLAGLCLSLLFALPGNASLPVPDIQAEDLANLAIPESLGTIQSRFQGSPGSRWIIHIQDVHAHLPAQENITAILEHLQNTYGIRTVALEGGWSSTSFAKSWGLPPWREKQMLARALLEDNILTGPGMSALFAPLPLTLSGIENQPLYEENRRIYLQHFTNAENHSVIIEAESLRITKAKKSLYNESLGAFDQEASAFYESLTTQDSRQAEKFIPYLTAQADKDAIALEDLGQILLFQEASLLQKSIDKEKLQAESKRLMEFYKNSRLNFEELLRSGKIPKDKLANYPASQHFLEFLKIQDRIKPRAFFHQLEKAIARVKEKRFISEEERALDARALRFLLARRIMTFTAVPRDLRHLAPKRSIVLNEMREAGLTEPLSLGLDFYACVRKRDVVFFKRLQDDPALQGNIAMVTGGFHTEGLSERFTKAGVSHIIITPDLAKEASNDALYRKRLEDTVAHQMLSDIQNRFLTPAFDEAFTRAVKTLKATASIPKAIEEITRAVEGNIPSANLAAPLTPEDFLKWAPAKQMKTVRGWLRTARGGRMQIIIAARTSALKNLFETRSGIVLWEKAIAQDRATTIGEIQDSAEYLNELVGIRARVQRVKLLEGSKIEEVIHARFHDALEKKTIAVIDKNYRGEGPLVLPEKPASLILARLMLEQHVVSEATPEFVDRVNELIMDILVTDKAVKRAV